MHGMPSMFLFQGLAVECAAEECQQAATILGKSHLISNGKFSHFNDAFIMTETGTHQCITSDGYAREFYSEGVSVFIFFFYSHKALLLNSQNKSTLSKSVTRSQASDTDNHSLHPSSSINHWWIEPFNLNRIKCLKFFLFSSWFWCVGWIYSGCVFPGWVTCTLWIF